MSWVKKQTHTINQGLAKDVCGAKHNVLKSSTHVLRKLGPYHNMIFSIFFLMDEYCMAQVASQTFVLHFLVKVWTVSLLTHMKAGLNQPRIHLSVFNILWDPQQHASSTKQAI